MPVVSHTVQIDAPPEEVFDLLTDPNRAPEWSRTTRAGEGPYPLSEGDEFTIEANFLGRSLTTTSTVFEHDRPSRYRYGSPSPVQVMMTADLAEADGGTRLTFAVDLDPGILFAAAGPLLKRQMRKQIEGDLAGLKALAEA